MSRPVRVEFPGASYHVMSRGNERKTIFHSVKDYQLFLRALNQMVVLFEVRLQCYCFMPNHFHLAITTPRGNLSQAMSWLQTTFTVRYNKKHKRTGHLFQGRYKAHVVGSKEYAKQLVQYIHLNPVRSGNKEEEIPLHRREKLENYRWSSHFEYSGKRKRDFWLKMDWLMCWGRNKRVAQYEYMMDIKKVFGKPIKPIWEEIRGGLVLGSERLVEKVKELMSKKGGREEKRWVKEWDREGMRKRITGFEKRERDKRIRMWLRVRIGGEQMSRVGQDFGYCDGSGVIKAIRRLEKEAEGEKLLRRKLIQYKRQARRQR